MAVAERGITHGMRYQARALAAQTAEKERPCWIAGTTALREDNEVRHDLRMLCCGRTRIRRIGTNPE